MDIDDDYIVEVMESGDRLPLDLWNKELAFVEIPNPVFDGVDIVEGEIKDGA